MVDFAVHHLPLPGAAPAAKIPGSLPPLPPPPVRRHDAPCEAGTRRAGALPRRTRGIRANPLPMRIPGHILDHDGEGFALGERSVGVVEGTRHLMRHLRAPPPP